MKPSEITREYIAGILCAMQVAGDDEASAAIEHFIVQLEEENEELRNAAAGLERQHILVHYLGDDEEQYKAKSQMIAALRKEVT